MSLDDEVRDELRALEARRRVRVPRVVDGRQGARVVVDGAEVTSFASNDYLGLAGDPRLAAAAAAALEVSGVGAGASRLIVGNQRAHVALEHAVADWMRCDGVRLFNTGFAANVGVLATLLRDGDVVFSDELNHASIIDGCRLSRARIVVVPHLDVAALERALREHRGRRRIVVSETVFSMDGDVADVEALAAVCRRADAALVLDEAHAIGVVGPEGRGVAAARGVRPDVLVGTFGKALGTFGAFVATTRAVADLLWNRARPLVFSTGMPGAIAAATCAAISIVRGGDGDARRRNVVAVGRAFRAQLPRAGGSEEAPIAPIVIGEEGRVLDVAAACLREGVLVAAVRPPTVPPGTARVRMSFSAAHRVEEAVAAARMLHRVIEEV